MNLVKREYHLKQVWEEMAEHPLNRVVARIATESAQNGSAKGRIDNESRQAKIQAESAQPRENAKFVLKLVKQAHGLNRLTQP